MKTRIVGIFFGLIAITLTHGQPLRLDQLPAATSIANTDILLMMSSPATGARATKKITAADFVSSLGLRTATNGILALNGLAGTNQTFAAGTSGADFNIASSSQTHTFHIPTASGANRGLLAASDFTTFSNKQAALSQGNNIQIAANVISAIPSGSNKQLQFNNSGAVGAATRTSYDTTSGRTTLDHLSVPYTVTRDQTNAIGATITFDLQGAPILLTTNSVDQEITFTAPIGSQYSNWLIRLTGDGVHTLTFIPPNGYTLVTRWGTFVNPPRNGITEYYIEQSGTTLYYDTVAPMVLSDITTALGFTPVNLAGDTMTGPLLVTALTNSALTASRAVVTGADKSLASSATTSTELGYVSGVTSAIQTQLNGKQASFTTGAGVTNQASVLSANLAAGSNVTLTTNANGQVQIAATGGAASDNWTASGTTNSSLPGVGSANGLVITNNIQLWAKHANAQAGTYAVGEIVTNYLGNTMPMLRWHNETHGGYTNGFTIFDLGATSGVVGGLDTNSFVVEMGIGRSFWSSLWNRNVWLSNNASWYPISKGANYWQSSGIAEMGAEGFSIHYAAPNEIGQPMMFSVRPQDRRTGTAGTLNGDGGKWIQMHAPVYARHVAGSTSATYQDLLASPMLWFDQDVAQPTMRIYTSASGFRSGGMFEFGKASGTPEAPTASVANDNPMMLKSFARDSSGNWEQGAGIVTWVVATGASPSQKLSIRTGDVGTLADRFWVMDDGKVGVATNAPSTEFEVFGTSKATTFAGTYDATTAGNTLKNWGYINVTDLDPKSCDNTGCTITTTSPSSINDTFLFSAAGATNANYGSYVTMVPFDIDTTVDMSIVALAVSPTGADGNVTTWTLSYYVPAASGVRAGDTVQTSTSGFTIISTPNDGTVTTGDVVYATSVPVTLTGWAAAMVPGRQLQITIARDGGDANAQPVALAGLTLKYKKKSQ